MFFFDIVFSRILSQVGWIWGSKLGFKKPSFFQFLPNCVQEAFKSSPRVPQARPKSAQECLKSAPRVPKSAPRAPQGCPRAPQERPQSVQEGPKSVQESESSETCCEQGDLNSKPLIDLRFQKPKSALFNIRLKKWMGTPKQGREGVNPYPFMG